MGNYSAPFYAAARAERKQYLHAGFSFNCDCLPCVQDWPLFDLLPPGPPGLALPELEPEPEPGGVRACAVRQMGDSALSRTEQSVLDTFHRVKDRIGALQAGQ